MICRVALPKSLVLEEGTYHFLPYHGCLECWIRLHNGLLSKRIILIGLTWQ